MVIQDEEVKRTMDHTRYLRQLDVVRYEDKWGLEVTAKIGKHLYAKGNSFETRSDAIHARNLIESIFNTITHYEPKNSRHQSD